MNGFLPLPIQRVLECGGPPPLCFPPRNPHGGKVPCPKSKAVEDHRTPKEKVFVLAAAILAVWAAAAVQAATTDTVRIEASTAKNEYRIGDQIEYVVAVEWKAPAELIRVEPSLALGVFEIVRAPEVKQKKIGRGWRQEQSRYFLSTFETGEFTIPEFTVVYRDADGAEKRVPTPPVKITVQSVAPLRPDETGIRDSKPPVVPHRRLPKRQILIAAAVALLLAAAAAAFVIRAMRKRRGEPAPALPPRPTEIVAREQLARIAQSDLLARGLIKEYFDQISDVIRAYLGQRYGFEGIVTTTSELLDELRQRLGGNGHVGLVADFSEEADLAKFAKWRPDRPICDHFLETAYRVIDETTPQPVIGQVGNRSGADGTASQPPTNDKAFQASGSKIQDTGNGKANSDTGNKGSEE